MLAGFSLTTVRDKRWWGHLAYSINKLKAAQTRGSGLAIHTCGFNCNWSKVVIVKEVIVFLAVGLSISCYTA